MTRKDLKKLKDRAEEGNIKPMFQYGMATDDPEEKVKYLKMAADNGYKAARDQLKGNRA